MPETTRKTTSAARRRQQQKRRRMELAILLFAAALVVALLLLIFRRGASDRTAAPAPTAAPATEPPAAEITAVPEATPAPEAAMAVRPTPTAPGFMPVFARGETTEKIIAITVDDCYQAENLQQIVDKALEVGGKITIFPIGENVLKEKQSQVLRYAWEHGMELENHTFTHNGLYRCSDQEMAEEIYHQQLALSYILGVDYQCHFLRPKGGDARRDQRMQKYIEQLGYKGIAHWSASGKAGYQSIADNLLPGSIYLFHTTDDDLQKLLGFMPWAVEQGYRLVTLNEMFGYAENETRPLERSIEEMYQSVPTLAPFETVYVPYRNPSYSYGVFRIQQKLIEQGYLQGEADGVYGSGTEDAVRAWQRDHGMEATGIADEQMQRAMFEV